MQQQLDAPSPAPQSRGQQQRRQTSGPPASQTWQPQQGDGREPAAASATAAPAAACSAAARTGRGRRAHGLSIRSRPRRAHGFRLRRRLVMRQGTPPAAGGKAAEREWGVSSSGESSSGGSTDDDHAGSRSHPASSGALSSDADSGTRAVPGNACGCSSSSRPWTPDTDMPCGESHCSSSTCSVCSGSSSGNLVACGDQRQCSCRPPSSARQVRLCPNLRAQQTILAPGRLVCHCACVCGSTSYNALCSQVLGKRREPPCHDLPAAVTGSQSGPGSTQQPPAPAISAPDCGLALRRLQEDLQRFRCFSSLRDDEAASDHEGHMAAGPAASKHAP